MQTPCSLSLFLSFSLSLSAFTTCYQSLQTVWIRKIVRRAWLGANKHTKSYNLVRLCVRWSPHAERNITVFQMHATGGSRGGTEGPDPLKNHKNIGFPSNIDPDPPNHKATKPAFNGGPLSTHQQNAISMEFRWWVDGGPFLVALRSFLITPSDKMFWIRACMQCVWTGLIKIKLSTNIMTCYFGTLIQHATKNQTSLRKCAFSIKHWWLRYVKHHRFYVEWINFVPHDSTLNLEKGPFVYKFV